MTKFNLFIKSIGLFLFLFVGNLFAQTTITLPSACNDCKSSSNGTAVVSSYGGAGCTGNAALNGTYTVGQAVTSANTMTLYANITQIGTWNIATTTNNGVTFSGSGSFTSIGCQAITLQASGTPTTIGSLIAVTNTLPSCSAFATVITSGGSITGLNCSGATNTGSLTGNVAASGVSSSIPYTGGNGGAFAAFSVVSTGVAGLTATVSAGSFVAGSGSLAVIISGTPAVAGGVASFALNIGGQTCTLTRTVSAGFNPSAIAAGVGSLSGKTCFDIALSNDNTNSCGALSSRVNQKSDFTLSSVNTQSYTFTPSVTVSNVRFYYINESGNAVVGISGGNSGNSISTAVTATVNYNTNNNSLALGLNYSNPMTTKIYVVYNINSTNNNNPADDRLLALSTNVKDCACCGANIAAGVWKEFLCHNLGADITLDPHLPTVGLQGAYIQWGKRGPNITEDSRIDWQTASSDGSLGFAAAPTLTDDKSGAIAGWSTANAADNSWGGTVKTASDPCPTGYRIPAQSEWSGVRFNNTASRTGTWTSGTQTPTNYGVAIHYGPDANTKQLTLPATGYHRPSDGALLARGSNGNYWSSSPINGGTQAYSLLFDVTAQFPAQTSNRTNGFPIRCIAQ